jgi:DNA-binding transcriptional LysR family regulator
VFFPEAFVAGFKLLHPDIPVRQFPIPNGELPEYTRRKDIDLIFCDFDDFDDACEIPGMEVYATARDRWRLAVPTGHPLASRESISLTEARDEEFIVPSDTYYHHDLQLCAKAGFKPKIAMTGFAEQYPDLMRHGNYVLLASGTFTPHCLRDPIFRLVPLNDAFCVRTFSLLRPKNAPLSTAAQTFLDYASSSAETHRWERSA